MNGELDAVKRQLGGLRRGQGLAHPQVVLDLPAQVRSRLCGTDRYDATAALAVRAAVSRAIDRLSDADQLIARAEFNLAEQHRFPTLTERQESLAAALSCSVKTIRRRSAQALTALCLLAYADDPDTDQPGDGIVDDPVTDRLREFWRLRPGSRLDVVCSEIPPAEAPYFADPSDRNYLRYAKFADLDSLLYLRVRLAQLESRALVRDFSPSEHHDTDADTTIVVGGPPWNAKCREFLPQLPYYFEPHELGEDDPLVVPALGNIRLGPRWSRDSQLVDDIAVFSRLTLASGSRIVLLGGCLTLGVLGAAKAFLDGKVGAANASWLNRHVGDADVVIVTEARRLGGVVDVPEMADAEPLLALSRTRTGAEFTVAIDNCDRRDR